MSTDKNFFGRSMPNARHCAYCEAALPIHTPASVKYCKAFACQQAWMREDLANRERQEKEAEAQLKYRLEQFRAAQSQELRTPTSGVAMIKVPHNDNVAVAVTDERRDVMAAHLTELASTLDDHNETPVKAPLETPLAPHLGEVLAEGCATCRGYCCLQGEQFNAFIQRSTLRRVLEEDSNLTVENIVEHYLSHIPDRAMESGCVYQTDTGCCLPAHLRADICHEFFCEGLHRFVKEHSKQVPDYSVIIATDKNQPMAASRISARGEFVQLDIEKI